jgi:hypothetical protein
MIMLRRNVTVQGMGWDGTIVGYRYVIYTLVQSRMRQPPTIHIVLSSYRHISDVPDRYSVPLLLSLSALLWRGCVAMISDDTTTICNGHHTQPNYVVRNEDALSTFVDAPM